MKRIVPKAKDADLWRLIWQELHRVHPEGILLEVQNVKAHRSQKEKQERSHFECFVADRNERANELARDGAKLDGGEMAQIRASTVQQKGKDIHAILQYAASFSLFGEGVARL